MFEGPHGIFRGHRTVPPVRRDPVGRPSILPGHRTVFPERKNHYGVSQADHTSPRVHIGIARGLVSKPMQSRGNRTGLSRYSMCGEIAQAISPHKKPIKYHAAPPGSSAKRFAPTRCVGAHKVRTHIACHVPVQEHLRYEGSPPQRILDKKGIEPISSGHEPVALPLSYLSAVRGTHGLHGVFLPQIYLKWGIKTPCNPFNHIKI